MAYMSKLPSATGAVSRAVSFAAGCAELLAATTVDAGATEIPVEVARSARSMVVATTEVMAIHSWHFQSMYPTLHACRYSARHTLGQHVRCCQQ